MRLTFGLVPRNSEAEEDRSRHIVSIQDQAIRLDASSALAHLTRGMYRLELDPPATNPALADMRRARALYSGRHPGIFEAMVRVAAEPD